MQLVPIDKENKPVNPREDFVKKHNSPEEIQQLLRNSCYDCHSNETIYPSYSKIAPISWMIKSHINDGRRYLNYSEWGRYNKDIKENILEKSIKSLQENSMPLPSYLSFHEEAVLNAESRKKLIQYFETILEESKENSKTIK